MINPWFHQTERIVLFVLLLAWIEAKVATQEQDIDRHIAMLFLYLYLFLWWMS